MITWMQKHKKYLVVTIWISTIAFVGAGFVGWGEYSVSKNKKAIVAKVGSQEITINDFQFSYNNLFTYYNNLSNGELSQEKAKELGLEQMVLSNLINESLLLNYANELGFTVLDQDVEASLIKEPNFHKDGVFDKNQYYLVLRNIGLTAKDYEKNLEKQILLEKLNSVLKLSVNEKEVEMIASSLFMKDHLKIDIVKVNNNDLDISQEELIKAWELNKNLYLTKTLYLLDTIFIPIEDSTVEHEELLAFYNENKLDYKTLDDKIKTLEEAKEDLEKDYNFRQTRRKALEAHLKLKKDEISTEDTMNIFEDDNNFPVDKIKSARIGDVLKPIEYNGGYLVIKINQIVKPQPMEFEEAKTFVKEKIQGEKAQELLVNKAKERMNNFEGIDIGFVSRDDLKNNIDGLSEEEFGYFLSKLFENKDKQGYVVFDNKAIVYEILDQKLLPGEDKIETYRVLLDNNIKQLKQGEVMQNLVEELRKKYTITQYYKGS